MWAKMWAKAQLWSHNSIQMYQVPTFVSEKDLFGHCSAFLKTWGLKVYGEGHHMIIYGQNSSLVSITPFNVPVINFCSWKRPNGDQRSRSTDAQIWEKHSLGEIILFSCTKQQLLSVVITKLQCWASLKISAHDQICSKLHFWIYNFKCTK